MPASRPVNALRARLLSALELTRAPTPLGWAHAGRPMAAALAASLANFSGNAESKPSNEAMALAVRAFSRDRQVQTFTQLKYVCYGLTMPVDADGNRLIDRPLLVNRLLELVDERKSQAKPFRRCYQGLLSGYFGFERSGENAQVAERNWVRLREFLSGRLAAVQASAGSLSEPPLWLTTLAAHSNLLQDNPCARYASALRSGDIATLKAVFSALGIESSSWVWHEAVLAYIYQLVEEDEKPFKAELQRALEMVQTEDKERRLPDVIAKSAAALLVMRYAHWADRPEHPLLRDTCIQRIGNPWLRPDAWDGAVRDEEARRMVESWLKRGLIKDFFERLAHDGAADPRRLNYWLKWEPQISDMWFVLGTASAHSKTKSFVELRKRMEGRDRLLAGPTPDLNNAFMMRIGNQYVVEFGLTGNACFVFPVESSDLKIDRMAWDIYNLKNQPGHTKLSHAWEWESRFDEALQGLLQRSAPLSREAPRATLGISRPAVSSAQVEVLRKRCAEEGVIFEDKTSKGGAVWVRPFGAPSAGMALLLKRMNFKLAPGKGYYLDLGD